MKKNSGEIMTVLGIVITAVALVVGYGYHYFTKKDDTQIEQFAEQIIEKESGIKIDFSASDKAKALTESAKPE